MWLIPGYIKRYTSTCFEYLSRRDVAVKEPLSPIYMQDDAAYAAKVALKLPADNAECYNSAPPEWRLSFFISKLINYLDR